MRIKGLKLTGHSALQIDPCYRLAAKLGAPSAARSAGPAAERRAVRPATREMTRMHLS